jgi:hypothetical protein
MGAVSDQLIDDEGGSVSGDDSESVVLYRGMQSTVYATV